MSESTKFDLLAVVEKARLIIESESDEDGGEIVSLKIEIHHSGPCGQGLYSSVEIFEFPAEGLAKGSA